MSFKPHHWLLVLLVLGGFFRFFNLDWDLKHSFHPDERNILGQTAGIQPGTGYRVQFFAYGQLPVYLYRATGELVSTPQAFVDLFKGSLGLAQWSYWALLALLGLGILWAFSKERWKVPAFGLSTFGLLLALFIKLSPSHFTRMDIFLSWFSALEPQRVSLAQGLEIPLLPWVSGAVVAAAAVFLSFLLALFLELEWVGIPLYAAAGATFLLGMLPGFLPSEYHLSARIGALAFSLMVAAGGIWLSWTTRWGRVLVAWLAVWVYFATRIHGGYQYTGYGECMIIGRWWAALFSTATIGVLYLFVKNAYKDRSMALLAAGFFSFSVVSIEQTHYCITESFITFMCVVMAYYSERLFRERGTWESYLAAGGAFGLSMAAKTSSLFYLLILLVGHLALLSQKSAKEWEAEDRKASGLRPFHNLLAGVFLAGFLVACLVVGVKFRGVVLDLVSMDQPLAVKIGWVLFCLSAGFGVLLTFWGVQEFKVLRAQMPQWIRLGVSLLLSFFLFCLLSPWSLLDYQGFMVSQNYEWHTVSIADACYVLQFKDTPRYLYQLWNLMSVELWWPLGVTVVLGALWVLARFLRGLLLPASSRTLVPVPLVRGKGFGLSLADCLLLVWFLAYFGFIGSWNTKFIRYMVPLIPAFCVFGARFLTDLFQWLKGRLSWSGPLKKAVLALVLGPSLFYSAAYMHIYAVPHTWIESSVWIFKNIPPQSAIATEAWDDGLPTGVDHEMDKRVTGTMGPQNYTHVDVTPYEMHGYPTDNSPVKKNYYAQFLQQPEYISIASKKLWYTLTDSTPEVRPHGFNAYPVTSRYYRALWSGLLGFKMVAEFHSFPSLFGWEHPDDWAEESFSVYDHPRVYLFKRFAQVPPEKVLRILETDDYVRGIDRERMRNIDPANVDAFIAERKKYLEDKGLLDKLDEAAPVTTSAAAAAPKIRPSAPVKTPQKPGTQAAALPEPEAKIDAPDTVPGLPDAKTLEVLKNYADNPVTEGDLSSLPLSPEEKPLYQWRAWATWVLLLAALGLLALPLALRLFSPLPAAAYSLSKLLGFFLFAWAVWFSASLHLCRFTLGSCWAWLLALAALSAYFYRRGWKNYSTLFAKHGRSWLIQEGAFLLAFSLFTLVKIYIPHIHDPVGEGYNGGGEAGMDFGFLASVVRSEYFPPQNMWMAGLPIGYTFYYGHLMMGVLTKTLGLVPAVTYNLGLITLFATIFSGAFGLAYALSGRLASGWIAGALCALAGNPAGARQFLEAFRQCWAAKSAGPLNLTYDFFGPTRVIPPLSINEFPYFSVLYGDMHAHTLAQPFALLLLGLILSLYLSKEGTGWRMDWEKLLAAGCLLGGIAFLNTWEVPVWILILGLALLVRSLSKVREKPLVRGLTVSLGCWVLSMILLNGWLQVKPSNTAHALAGGTAGFLASAGLGLGAALAWLYRHAATRDFTRRFLATGACLAAVLVSAGLLWAPFFTGFHPQQSTVLWVLPTIRTSVRNYFAIYGFFLVPLLLSFLVAYEPGLRNWIEKKTPLPKKRIFWLDRLAALAERLASPQGALSGMLSLGLAFLVVIWGVSWVQWTEPADRMLYSRVLAAVVGGLFAAALFLRERAEVWLAFLSGVLLWAALLILQAIHLVRDLPLTLNLGFFSVLWMTGFFYLGLALKTAKDRGLSFAYFIVSCFFLLTSGLEIFSMSEYFGFGDGMRNNSLFKYGIIAWELASVAAGVFVPRVLDTVLGSLRSKGAETGRARGVLLAFSGSCLFTLVWALMDGSTPYLKTPFVSLLDIVMVTVILVWGLLEGWFKGALPRTLFIASCSILILLSLFAVLPQGYGRLLAALQNWGSDLDAGFLLPAGLAWIITGLLAMLWEGKRDLGRRMAAGTLAALFLVMLSLVSIYPLAASWRKCHGFFDFERKKWGGFLDPPTLNGLNYIRRADPGDDAAIRFLNRHVPGQPCLLEFVGAGYNTWGSRFSIFTGIPALMGWDGHVGEWVGARLGDDIRNRVSAVQRIFTTPDPRLAKRMLDAYGVRLVMVGTAERHGAAEKPGYPTEGLDKFKDFLPLIYKNPQVEIYYNAPPAK